MFQTLFSMGLTIYLWAVAPSFGNQSECSPFIKYVLFAFDVPALGAGRYIGLIFASLLTALYILISCYDIWSSYDRRNLTMTAASSSPPINQTNEPHPPEPPDTRLKTNLTPHVVSQAASTYPPQSNATTASTVDASLLTPSTNPIRHVHRRPRRRHWTGELDPMLVGIVIWQILMFTYFIVSSELFLKRNPTTSNGATQWGFGQILALIVVMPSALSVVDALSRYGFGKVSRRSNSQVLENIAVTAGARQGQV
ncbi:hypothetical protein BJ165DRAFT_475372 [Panaeolus papilionaceus]|nr:hypothetical protein BJ165DRAFT_475372 [Panaeolus papilionaceus]